MLKDLKELIGQKGSMMIEAIAMLGLISMVTPVLYKKAAERTSELQDINSATQMRTLVKAMDDYIKDNYVALSGAIANNGSAKVTATDLEPYLPYGFKGLKAGEGSKAFKPFQLAIHKKTTGSGVNQYNALTGMVLAETEADLPRIRSSKIASMVGANGGIVTAGAVEGVQGGWSADLKADYNLSEATKDGSIAATSTHSVASSSIGGGADDVLYRKNMGNAEFNTMAVDLVMGSAANIKGVKKLIASGNEVLLRGAANDTAATNLTVTGNATMADLVALGTGKIAKAFTAEDISTLKGVVTAEKDVNIGQNLKVTGESHLIGIVNADDNVNVGKILTVTDESHLKGIVNADDNVNVGKILTVTEESHLMGVVNTDTDVNVGGVFTAKGLSYFRQDVQMDEALTVEGLITANGGIKIKGDLEVTGKGTFGTGVIINTGGLDVKAGGATIRTGGLKVEAGGADILGGTVTDSLTVTGNAVIDATSATFSQNNFKVGDSNIFSNGTELGLKAGPSGGNDLNINSQNFEVNAGSNVVAVKSDNFTVGSDATLENSVFYVDPTATDENTSNKSIFMRKGAIEIAANSVPGSNPSANPTTGYIKLDRVLGNKGYTSPGLISGTGVAYDDYQVNPAYTSVMHDIKLTSRGGARLSDVLPEFINKGIYVIDNTYCEATGSGCSNKIGNWENFSDGMKNSIVAGTMDGSYSCPANTASCVASPWLGFVPTPQCPPGYAKVITINPIRWKMAEAYSVTAANVDAGSITNRTLFEAPRYPHRFLLNSASGSGAHTHDSDTMPLTFQTSTWLNTTINKLEVGGTFKGWNAIMGFLYRGTDYQEYLTKLGQGTSLNGKIVWNLFPVYQEEMTAISEVYCYFERRNASWDTSVVDTGYNQLMNFRDELGDKLGKFGSGGYNKTDKSYQNRLNDPSLKYTDPW